MIRAVDSSIEASKFMRIHFLSFESYLTTFFKQAFPFVRAINYFQRTVRTNMFLNFAFFYLNTTLVSARYNSLWTILRYMLFNFI